jgi:glutamine synthetase adenylyltransferase
MPAPITRIPVKLHRQVSLIRASEPILIEELLARKTLARMVAGRLSETVLLVSSEDEETILDELRRLGQTPRVVR